jgi:hypothetical protein
MQIMQARRRAQIMQARRRAHMRAYGRAVRGDRAPKQLTTMPALKQACAAWFKAAPCAASVRHSPSPSLMTTSTRCKLLAEQQIRVGPTAYVPAAAAGNCGYFVGTNTALGRAVHRGVAQVVSVLLSAKAPVNAVDSIYADTALHHATRGGTVGIAVCCWRPACRGGCGQWRMVHAASPCVGQMR